MHFEELTCGLCDRQYANSDDLIPRLLPECGHTFCTKCLNTELQKSTEGPFICPEDQTECERKASAEQLPKNFALIRLAERTIKKLQVEKEQEEKKQAAQIAALEQQIRQQEEAKRKAEEEKNKPQDDLCPTHQRKLEIICIEDRTRICSNCALFGAHKAHDIRMEDEVVGEITVRTELLMQIYELIEETSSNRVDQRQVEVMENEFDKKSSSLQNSLREKFQELRAALALQEQQAEFILKKNLAHIEQELKRMKMIPQRLFTESDDWTQEAKTKLDLFEQNLNVPNYINYEMLEQKSMQGGIDIINKGEELITELEKYKDVSAVRVQNQIEQLNLTFDQKIAKQMNSVVNCARVDGVQIDDDEVSAFSDVMKENKYSEVKEKAKKKYAETDGISRQSMNMLTGDENDLLSESPFMSANTNKASHSQSMHANSTASNFTKPDEGGVPVQSIEEQPLKPAGGEEFEEIDEVLINEIEDYLKGVMEANEKSLDMSDSPIGSSGAKCVAAAITFCEGLEVMKLSNCGIQDAGAQCLFEELQSSKSVEFIDLSGNTITERSFDSLSQLLQNNQSIRAIDLTNIAVASQFQWKRLSKFGDRVIR